MNIKIDAKEKEYWNAIDYVFETCLDDKSIIDVAVMDFFNNEPIHQVIHLS